MGMLLSVRPGKLIHVGVVFTNVAPELQLREIINNQLLTSMSSTSSTARTTSSVSTRHTTEDFITVAMLV